MKSFAWAKSFILPTPITANELLDAVGPKSSDIGWRSLPCSRDRSTALDQAGFLCALVRREVAAVNQGRQIVTQIANLAIRLVYEDKYNYTFQKMVYRNFFRYRPDDDGRPCCRQRGIGFCSAEDMAMDVSYGNALRLTSYKHGRSDQAQYRAAETQPGVLHTWSECPTCQSRWSEHQSSLQADKRQSLTR